MSTIRARSLVYLVSVIALVAFCAWSCGGNKENSGTGNPSPTSSAPPAEAPAGNGTTAASGSTSNGEVSLAVGEKVFHERCELCHGPNGMGDGPGGAALNPKPRNFHDTAYMKTLSDDQIFTTIMNGKAGTGMPPWKGIVSESEAKSLILKVRSFGK
ncbi:MAG TPA: cytochrome c [Candidatus Eisenbacteria bacterium]|jgi:mono/diheme cytochrome c family protein|nr:cytochrome c [Candidatus Eisenbacteria bacterium]